MGQAAQKLKIPASVTVLGLSKSGSAVARYVQAMGGQCFLSETLPATPSNESLRRELEGLGVDIEMGGHSKRCFTHSDLVVVSPGIPPSSAIFQELLASGKEIISEVEFAYRQATVPVIGITGTNGKTTTTTLISEILSRAGYKAPACGNIGLPVTEVLLTQPDCDYWVVELSSFQLQFSPTLRAQIAVFNNFKPDHLDWHGSVEAYQRAKLKLFTGEQSPQYAVVLAEDPVSQIIYQECTGQVVGFSRHPEATQSFVHQAYLAEDQQVTISLAGKPSETLFSVEALQIIGAHNHENVLAAASTALLLGVEPTVIREACLAFQGVEHRLERVVSLGNTTFYNDSKATNPDATISALRGFSVDQKIVLIAGGRDKMGPLEEFVQEIKAHVQHVVLIGEASDRFADALRQGGFYSLEFCEGLEQAVQVAYRLSQGTPVLFSPACASFDMFKNFEERGRLFKAAVHGLEIEKDTQALGRLV